MNIGYLDKGDKLLVLNDLNYTTDEGSETISAGTIVTVNRFKSVGGNSAFIPIDTPHGSKAFMACNFEKVEPKPVKQFVIAQQVAGVNNYPPSPHPFVNYSYDAAVTEAERLATKTGPGSRFVIMQVVAIAENKTKPVIETTVL